jgi:hypothetical protein
MRMFQLYPNSFIYMSQDILTKVIYILSQYVIITLTKNLVSRASVKILFSHKSVRNFLEPMNVGPNDNRCNAKEILECRISLWHDPLNNVREEILKL